MTASLLALLLASGASAPEVPDKWAAAEKAIVRLSESDFEGLPDPVREFMRKRDCRVPQPWEVSAVPNEPQKNVVSGSFASPDQTDWIMLCSREGRSAIHVYWGGAARCPEPFSERPDRSYLQGIGAGKIGFSRELFRLEPRHIRHRYEYWNSQPGYEGQGPEVPQLDHDAIDDAFVPKASAAFYCRRGEWEGLAGSD